MKFHAALILATTVFLSLVACGARTTDEEQVRALLDAVETAAESRDASDVLEHVADEYSDASGFDKTRLRDFLRGYFLANPKVELLVNVRELEIPVPGLAKLDVSVTSLPAGDRATLRVELRRSGDDWRVTRADRVSER